MSGSRVRRSCPFRTCSALGSCCMPRRVSRIPRSRRGLIRRRVWSGVGDDDLPNIALRDCAISRGRVGRVVFAPQQVAEVKAIACELPRTHELPLSRFSRVELHRLIIERGVTEASASTIWRWLHEDAIKPWQVRSWIFPRDPNFADKAGRALDLYARIFEGERLALTSTSSAPTRRPSCRRWAAITPACRQRPDAPASSSLTTCAAAPWRTSQHATCITPTCLTALSRRRGSCRSAGSSTRS